MRPHRSSLAAALVALLGLVLGPAYAASPALAQSGGSISGTVVDASTGSPLAGILATVYVRGSDGYVGVAGEMTTGADGTYSVGDLYHGVYSVDFQNTASTRQYAGQWGRGEPDLDHASLISVPEFADVTGVDAAMGPTDSISGRIIDAVTGLGISNISITVNQPVGVGDGDYCSGYCFTRTDAEGRYTVTGLSPGSYDIYAGDRDHVGQWWGGQLSHDSAVPVVVGQDAQVTGADLSLAHAGHLRGTLVRDSDGSPVAGIRVDVFGPAEGYRTSFSGTTDDSGDFSVDGLPPGSYDLHFAPGPDTLDQWWQGVDESSSTPVRVTADQTSDIDATLTTIATQDRTVSGRVLDESGDPLAGVRVRGFDTYGNIHETTTASDGTYTMHGLQAHDVSILFDSGDYFEASYDGSRYGTSDSAAATRLSMTSASSYTGIDITLVRGAVISGTVTDSSGAPVAGDSVQSYSVGPAGRYTTRGTMAFTAPDGSYRLPAMRAGTYAVRAGSGPGLASTFWGSHQTLASADTLTLTAGGEQDGIDVVLPADATVAGQITDTDGHDLVARPVALEPLDPDEIVRPAMYTTSDREGGYSFGSVPPGSYRLTFYCDSGSQVASTSTLVLAPGDQARRDLVLHLSPEDPDPRAPRGCDISSVNRPQVTGTPRVGHTLGVAGLRLSPSSARVGYAWFVDGHRVGGAAGATLRLRKAWIGHRVQARVVASRPGYLPLHLRTVRTPPVRAHHHA